MLRISLFLGLSTLIATSLPAEVFRTNSRSSAESAMRNARAGDVIEMAPGIYEDCVLFFGDPRPSPELTTEEMEAEDRKAPPPKPKSDTTPAPTPKPTPAAAPTPAPEFTRPVTDWPESALGTAEKSITFRAQTPGKTIFTGASGIRIKGKYLVVEGFVFDQAWRNGPIVAFSFAENCRLTNCAFIECGTPEFSWGRIVDITNRSRNTRVDHCLMKGNLSIGMGLKLSPYDYDSSHVQFDHNYFKDIIRRTQNGQEAVQLGQGGFPGKYIPSRSGYGIVEYNLFENASGDPEICSDKSSGNIYRFNTFRGCKGELCLRGWDNARVEGNYFFGNGIRVHGNRHIIINNYFEDVGFAALDMPGNTSGHLIAHNTIVHPGFGISYGHDHISAGEGHGRDTSFINNIIVVEKKGTAIRDLGSENTTWRGNIVFGGSEKSPAAPENTGIQVIDPKLVPDEKTGVYRLASDSPALKAGQSVPEVPDDIQGQKRGERVDPGCDEISTESSERKVLTPSEVGPDWMKGEIASIQRIPNPQRFRKPVN